MAGILFKFHEKTFTVDQRQIMTYSQLSASHSFNTEEKKNGKNMPKTKEIGPGIGSLSFNLDLSMFKGNDVKAEHDWWVNECEKGSYSYIFMGGYQFGNYKWRVNRVDVSDLVTLNDGNTWKSCTLSIGFEEYYVKVKQTKAEKKAARLQKKMRKAMEKAENAKNDKAREKAMAKAEKLAQQFKDQSEIAAKERADKAKAISEIDERIDKIIRDSKNQDANATSIYSIEDRKAKEQKKKGAA